MRHRFDTLEWPVRTERLLLRRATADDLDGADLLDSGTRSTRWVGLPFMPVAQPSLPENATSISFSLVTAGRAVPAGGRRQVAPGAAGT